MDQVWLGETSPLYLYSISCKPEEKELARMEQRVVFGMEADEADWIWSPVDLEPSRSPFVRQRLKVQHQAASLEELVRQLDGLKVDEQTFKVRYMKSISPHSYDEQRQIERELGAVIRGQVDVRSPERLLGVAYAGDSWWFGELEAAEAVWLKHQNKPQGYSTALNTRVARSIVNIALPDHKGKTLVDPCCGIGTVLVEALSMGIEACGSDVNPLAATGARINLAHYGYPNVVKLRDIAQTEGSYDAAVVDLPYNLCSVSPREEQLRILKEAARLAPRLVLVTTEELDMLIEAAGLGVLDRCKLPKGKLVRQIILCDRGS